MTRSRGKLTLFALALGAFAIGTSEFSGMTLLPFYASEFGRDQPTAAHAVSLYAIGVVVGAPILAVVTSRWSRMTAAIALILSAAAANLLTATMDSYSTMLAARFLSGLPHGAFFGQAALIAAGLFPKHRGQSVAFVMNGLAAATIVGAPVANLLGQSIGWRWGFAVAAAAAAACAASLAVLHTPLDDERPAALMTGLGALRSTQVWLTLAAGAIGFGGLFAVYAYLPSIAVEVAGLSTRTVPWLLVVTGIGLLVGNLLAGWATDRNQRVAAISLLLWSALGLLLLPFAAKESETLFPLAFAIAFTGGLGPVLQMRLMDVAGKAQTLAAAMHHAAFNLANALGPWLAGLAISTGFGWAAAGPVGALLALGGLTIYLFALWSERKVSA